MAIQWRGPVPDSNYSVGREGNAITLIVDHWTVVMFEAAIRRFLNPASILSAHYVIGQDGRIVQLVSEADTAYHAGRFDVNLRSIGIEHEAGPAMPPSDALYAASAQLHAEIASRHGLALRVGTTVLPHRAIRAASGSARRRFASRSAPTSARSPLGHTSARRSAIKR